MYVYGEEVFLINFIMDYILCIFSYMLTSGKINFFRALFAASAGGIYSVICLYYPAGTISKIGVCLLMALIAEKKGAYDILTTAMILLCGSMVFSGGTVFFLSVWENTIGKGLMQMLSGAFTGGFIAISCLGRIKHERAVKSSTVSVTAQFMGRNISLSLLNDTGNLLTTQGGYGISVLSEEAFYKVCPELRDILTDDGAGFSEVFPEIYSGRVSFINSGSTGGEKILPVIKIDSFTYEGKIILPAYISPAKISDGRFDGIINLNLTGGKNDK